MTDTPTPTRIEQTAPGIARLWVGEVCIGTVAIAPIAAGCYAVHVTPSATHRTSVACHPKQAMVRIDEEEAPR